MEYVPFPHFSSEKVAIWFAQVESVFALNGVLSDSDKYDYIVTQIPINYSSLIEDILLNPPPESKYDHIKYEFIKRVSIFRLKNEQLGSEKPSEFLQRLVKLADTRVPIEVIMNIWLNNLPQAVREVVTLESSGHRDTLGQIADKVMALLIQAPLPPKIMHPPDQFQIVMQRIDELTKQMKIMQLMIDGHEQQSPGRLRRSGAAANGCNEDKGYNIDISFGSKTVSIIIPHTDKLCTMKDVDTGYARIVYVESCRAAWSGRLARYNLCEEVWSFMYK